MKFPYILTAAIIASFPMASFVLIALEVFMVFKIAKSHNAVHLGDIIWFCSIMTFISLVLKFIAAWMHFIPLIGQASNSLVAAIFVYFVFDVADAHYKKLAEK